MSRYTEAVLKKIQKWTVLHSSKKGGIQGVDNENVSHLRSETDVVDASSAAGMVAT